MATIWYIVGTAIFVSTTVSLLKVLVVPRRAWSIVATPLLSALIWLFHAVARRVRRADTADRFLGFLGPLYVVMLLTTFLSLYTVAFAMLLLAAGDASSSDWSDAFAESGSSIFTLGYRSSNQAVASVVDITAAATGMIVIALFIAYLPTLYAAVKERERFVKLVQGRLGANELSGVNLLAAHYERRTDPMLVHLYRDAERWAIAVSETHAKYPVLVHFRAPRAPLQWLDTMVAVADAAVLHEKLIRNAPAETRAVVDAIELCLDELVRAARVDPLPARLLPAAAVDALVERLAPLGVELNDAPDTHEPMHVQVHRGQAAALAQAIQV